MSSAWDINSDFLPGSKRPRNPAPIVQEEFKDWSTHSYIKTVAGVPTEFFTLEALCIGLERPPVTIRLWIRKGYIPEATYRMPARVVNGVTHKGRRLYTRAQVEAVLRVCEAHGIRQNRRVSWVKHHPAVALEIAEAWTNPAV